MHWEVIIRTLLGVLTGFICGLFPLVLGFVLGKNGGGIIGVFVCTVCGGLFGFLEKSVLVLSIIVAIIIIIFLLVDKSRPAPVRRGSSGTDAPGKDNEADEKPIEPTVNETEI